MRFHHHPNQRSTCDRSDLVTCEPCLGRVCGSNNDLEGVDFTPEENNLVYLDKVFSYNKSTSCPIPFEFCTAGPLGNRFEVEFTMEDRGRRSGGCCDNSCVLEPDAVFRVDRAVAFLDYIDTRPPGQIDPCQVTLNGDPVDDVTFINGRYLVNTSGVLSKVQRTRCQDVGLPSKTFFLVRDVGPFDIRLSFEVEGVVNTNGKNCRFCAKFTMRDRAPDLCLPSCCPASFAVPNLALPCAINGIAPDVLFQFGGSVEMVNPEICVNCSRRPLPGMEEDCCNPCCTPSHCGIVLSANLVIEPSIQVESVRQTLFCVKGCEAMLPCSPVGTETGEEDCPDPFAPACSCGTSRPAALPSRDCDCENEDWFNEWEDDCQCNDHRRHGRPDGRPDHRQSCNCNSSFPTSFQFNGCNGCTW